MDLIKMWGDMGLVARAIAFILVIMSMISFGVAIERIYTFTQARKQSKLYAPQVAKHLKDGRLKDAIAISSSKTYRYSHLAKVVLAGLQEYQFQQESGANLSREDLVDTVRRAIQRASALTANDLKKGVAALATIGATAPFVGLLGTVVGIITPSRASRPPGRAASARCRPVSRKRSSKRRSDSSSPFPRCGSTTTSPAVSSTSTSKWTTPRRSCSTTSSRRPRNTRYFPWQWMLAPIKAA